MGAIRNFLLSNYFWPFAFGSHFLVLILLYFKFGINFSNESEKYLAIAGRLNLENFREELRFLWGYSSYIFFLAFFLKLGFPVYVILIIQNIIVFTGFYLFYKFITSQSFFSEFYSRICLLVIVTCPMIVYWQLTFYTESIFPALVMISTCYLFKPKTNLLSVILLLVLMFCRPVGVFYVIALVFVRMKKKESKFASWFLVGGLASVFVIVLFFLPVHYNDFALPIYQGSIICGFPAYPNSILPPGNYTLADVYSAFLQEHGFMELLKISLEKIITFFTVTRPYYSLSHNLINSIYYIFILGGLSGFYRLARQKTQGIFRGYFSGIFMGSLLIVALIYNEWSERFIVPILPFFILISLIFINDLRAKTSV